MSDNNDKKETVFSLFSEAYRYEFSAKDEDKVPALLDIEDCNKKWVMVYQDSDGDWWGVPCDSHAEALEFADDNLKSDFYAKPYFILDTEDGAIEGIAVEISSYEIG